MKQTKVIKKTFELDAGEVANAIADFIIKTNKYSPEFRHQAVEMHPILSEGTELTGVEMAFTTIKDK